jgi:hypothetical protein
MRSHFTLMLPCSVIDFFVNNQPDALVIPILFCYKNLRVSGIFSTHHQELSTVLSALVSFTQVYDDRFQAESRWNAVVHNSKSVIFQEKLLKVSKCYNFLWAQRQQMLPRASFANCVMTLYLLKVHLQTFLSITITQKCQILSCDTLVANKRYIYIYIYTASVV